MILVSNPCILAWLKKLVHVCKKKLTKDVEKMGSKLEGLHLKINGIADQIKGSITMELKKDMEDMFEKWGRKEECLLDLMIPLCQKPHTTK